MNIVIIGSGGHCLSVLDVLRETSHNVLGLIDNQQAPGTFVSEHPILGSDEDLPKVVERSTFLHIGIGKIGSCQTRKRVFEKFKNLDYKFASIVSPLAYVSPTSRIGPGSIVMHGAIVNAYAEIGENCIINSRSLIEHGARIGDHTHISTGAIVNGDTTVGPHSFIGSGAILNNGIVLKEESIVSAGVFLKESLNG